jgi:hypothetical protein
VICYLEVSFKKKVLIDSDLLFRGVLKGRFDYIYIVILVKIAIRRYNIFVL